MSVENIARFGYDLRVLDNRIDIVNQMLGYGVGGSIGNPLVLRLSKGMYTIMVGDCEFLSFRIYDCDGAERAIERMEGLNDGIWYLKGRYLEPINTT